MAERFSLLDHAYAHRGLWTKDGMEENSLEAILAAAEAGFGCEIDVRPAACGTPVVFHDEQLDRMTKASGPVSKRTADELMEIGLAGGGTLPKLTQVLEAWPGETPLLVEMKIDGSTDAVGFAQLVASRVAEHAGPAALMSFSQRAVTAIPDELMKGALVMPSMLSREVTLDAMISAAATLAPDYLACHVTDAMRASGIATDYALPVAIWTVTSEAMADSIRTLPVSPIFEGFDPAFARG
ncbi:MAG: glycerophosphodiester phosphodiesterase family protein [Henriciella sp.]|uniref:glycerophosphodiester phosphodiesterase family protein n=1 Tax=Henriciella sp. TaxID=1968823 RepID=UPI0032ED77C5